MRRIRRLLQANMKFEGLDAQTILNEGLRGKLNNVDDLRLRKDGTSTTISDALITTISMIVWSAKDAEAAAKSNSIWYSSTEKGRVILNHTSTSTSTVMYDMAVFN
jgi:hypothetical protein